MKKQTKIILLCVLLVVLAGIYISNKNEMIKDNDNLSQQVLEEKVVAVIESELRTKYEATKDPGFNTWDKKITVTQFDESKKIAKGTWQQGDTWGWIAWKQENGNWNVSVSFDGFKCTELDMIPSDYDTFFQDTTYQNGKKYCS